MHGVEEPDAVIPADRDRIQREWTAEKFSLPLVFYVFCLLFGTLAVVVSVDYLISPPSGTGRGPVGFLLAVGLYFVVVSLAFIALPARRVRLTATGDIILVTPRRSMRLKPGQLRSVRTVFLDPQRLAPYVVRGPDGRILLFSRMNCMKDLETALRANSPAARIVRLERWTIDA
jgi:hypothetical protein